MAAVWPPSSFVFEIGILGRLVLVMHSTLLGYAIEGAYRPDMALAMAWNDPELEINWPCADPVLSDKDQAASSFSQIKQLLSEQWLNPKL